ncbi:MAG: efflux RND transporter periplasmic adaptor subunit [Bacteroidota bacterium]
MNGRQLIISVILSGLLLMAGYSMMSYFGSRQPEIRQMSFREVRKPVRVNSVAYEAKEISLSGLGKVVSESAIDLVSEVQGEVRPGSVSLKRGQAFRKGQVLFRVDNQEALLNLYAQKSNFMTAVAGVLPDLKVDFSETFPIWETYFENLSVEGILPALPELKNAKEKVFFSTRNILNQFYSIKSAEKRLSKYTVRAPFSGSLVEVMEEVNSVVNPGTRVARIARSNRLELEVPFRPEDLAFLKVGTTVKVFDENQAISWPGRVNRIGSALDPTTQSINVYIQFNPGLAPIFEGQYLQAEIPGTRLREVMEIPRNAIINQNQVYVVQDSLLKIRDVRIEKLNKETLLFSGLDTTDFIVVEPVLSAYENMPVQMNVSDQNGGLAN